MRLYVTPFAPNALRVQIFLLEKGISADIVDVSATQRSAYMAINPLGQVPTLELDNGDYVSESLTICAYLDEISGEPRLFGSTAEQRARVGTWERRAEMSLFIPSVEYGHHTHPMFVGRLTQHPEWAGSLIPPALRMIDLMAAQLDRTPFLAGDELSIADFTGALGYFGLVAYGAIPPAARPSVQRWSTAMVARPSMAPLHQAAQFLQSVNSTNGATVR